MKERKVVIEYLNEKELGEEEINAFARFLAITIHEKREREKEVQNEGKAN